MKTLRLLFLSVSLAVFAAASGLSFGAGTSMAIAGSVTGETRADMPGCVGCDGTEPAHHRNVACQITCAPITALDASQTVIHQRRVALRRPTESAVLSGRADRPEPFPP